MLFKFLMLTNYHGISRMPTGGNNLCEFVIIRGLQSANVIPQSVSSTADSYGISRMPTEGNQREFLFYMSFQNKRSKPIEEHLCNQSSSS